MLWPPPRNAALYAIANMFIGSSGKCHADDKQTGNLSEPSSQRFSVSTCKILKLERKMLLLLLFTCCHYLNTGDGGGGNGSINDAHVLQ